MYAIIKTYISLEECEQMREEKFKKVNISHVDCDWCNNVLL